MKRRAWWTALLLVTILATTLRLYGLDDVPPGFFIDEAQDALDAHAIYAGEHFPAFVEGPNSVKGRGREPIFHYAMAAAFRVFGVSLHTVRLTPALLGIATVALFFVLCEKLWGLRFALLASSLLAVSRWHLTFSRVAMRAITVPLWITVVGLALVFLVRRRTIGAAIVFGGALGLGFYTYQAFWAVPPALVVVLLVGKRSTSATHGTGRLAIAAALAFAVTLIPLAVYVLERPAYFAARLGEVWDPTTQGRDSFSLRDNAQKVLFMLHLRGDEQPRHNIPGRPLLDPITGVAFAVGAFVLLKRWRNDPLRSTALLAFYAFLVMPSVFSDAGPHAMRALGAVLAACAIAAAGMEVALSLLPSRRLAVAVAALAIAAAGWLNATDLFREWGSSPEVAADFSGDIPRFFGYAADLTHDGDVYACPYVYSSPNLRFLRLAEEIEWSPVADSTAFTAAPGGRDRIYICDAPQVNSLIERLYPQAPVVGRYSVFGASTGKIYRIGATTLRPQLTEEEQRDTAYLLDRVHADFARQVRQW